MAKPETKTRHVGNFEQDDLDKPTLDNFGVPMIEQWRLQGIGHVVTEPVATERYTSEELTRMGLVGVTLIDPPDEAPSE